MKRIIPIIGLSMLVPTALSGAEKPNIIFFLIDDNGWVDSQVSYGPEVYPNNLRFNTPVTIADMFPTILDFAGVKEYTAVQSIDGQSLVKLVTKGSKLAAKAKGELKTQAEENAFVVPVSVSGIDPERQIISHYPNKWRTRRVNDVDYMSAIREGEWKLVYRMITRKLELYNLNEDLGELNDISAQRPEIVTRLAKDLSKQLRIWKAPMPLIPSTGAPVPMPDEVL